jgi:membrane dipeptidase
MKKTRYDGYRSFQYLTPGRDYEEFDLPVELNRVDSSGPVLSEEQTARVEELMERHTVVSFHDHPTLWPGDWPTMVSQRRQGRDWMGYEGISRSGVDAFFDGFTDGTGLITSRHGWKWDEMVFDLGMRLSDIAHQDFVVVAKSAGDIARAKANGQVALVLSVEALTPIENEIDRIDVLYGIGVRCMGLVYSSSNQLGSGLQEEGDGGLTGLGKEAVRRLNDLGVIIDVAHVNDRTSLEAIEMSSSPVCITHAGAREVWNSKRMKPDEVIIACAERGGVIGIEAAPHSTISQDHSRHSLDSVMAHFEYCKELVGIDHVAFGPDTLFGDHVGVHKMFSHVGIGSTVAADFERVEFVNGIESPAEAMRNICGWLVQHGYSDEEIGKALGGNILRVMTTVLG